RRRGGGCNPDSPISGHCETARSGACSRPPTPFSWHELWENDWSATNRTSAAERGVGWLSRRSRDVAPCMHSVRRGPGLLCAKEAGRKPFWEVMCVGAPPPPSLKRSEAAIYAELSGTAFIESRPLKR